GLLKKQIRDFSSGGFGQGGWRIWRCGNWILRNEPNSGGGADVVLRNEASPLPNGRGSVLDGLALAS
ncbi:MAG: hypothetical protein ACRD4G_20095, partial [Bryobacteraceae bacterium]